MNSMFISVELRNIYNDCKYPRMKSKITIVIPAYNREKLIARTLDSLLAQSFEDWECIVVDDHSTDSTWSVLEKYTSKYPKIRIFKNERTKGACGARNTGLSHAKSDLIQFFDSDDEMHPDLLSELYSHFSADVDVLTCWTNVVDVNSGERIKTFENITEGYIHDSLMRETTYVDTNCALMRKQIVECVGGWSEDCPSYQEWDFHLKLSTRARYKTHRKHLINYYVGGSDTISKSLPRYVSGRLYVLDKFKLDFLTRHPVAYMKKMVIIYDMIMNGKDDNERKKAMNIFVSNTSPFMRLLVKCLFTPYKFMVYGRK